MATGSASAQEVELLPEQEVISTCYRVVNTHQLSTIDSQTPTIVLA